MRTLAVIDHNPYSNLVQTLIDARKFDDETNLLLEFVFDNNMSKQFILGECTEEYITESMNEGKFADWIKDKAEKAKEQIGKVKDKTVELFAKIGQSFSTFIKFIVDKIKQFLVAAWDFIKEQTNSKLNPLKDQVIEKISTSKLDKTKFKKEIDQLKEMGQAGMQLVGQKIPAQIGQAATQAGNEETNESLSDDVHEWFVECLTEAINDDISSIEDVFDFDASIAKINEAEPNADVAGDKASADTKKPDGHDASHDKSHGSDHGGANIPGLSKLAHKIAHYPPFSWLHGFEDTVKEKTNNFLETLSVFLNKRAGSSGPHEFELVGNVAALTAGAYVKTGVTEIVKSMGENAVIGLVANSIPGLGFLLKLLKYIAKAIWLVGVCEAGLAAMEQTK